MTSISGDPSGGTYSGLDAAMARTSGLDQTSVAEAYANPLAALADQARSGKPVEQGAALRALDANTLSRGATDSIVQDARAAREVCTIEVRYTAVEIAGFHVANHGFVLTTDADSQNYFRGGPEARENGLNSGGSNSGSSGSNGTRSSGGDPQAGVYGNIATEYGAYRRNTVDWTTSPTGQQNVAVRPGNCDAIERSMISTADAIEASRTSYGPLGPNSNTTAREILDRAGFPGVQPVVTAPGWNATIPLGR